VAFPDFVRPPFVYAIEKSPDALRDWLDEYEGGTFQTDLEYGYEIVSISVAGTPTAPVLAAVLALREESFVDQVLRYGDEAQIEAQIANDYLIPRLVGAVGDNSGAAFLALVCWKLQKPPLAPIRNIHLNLSGTVDTAGNAPPLADNAVYSSRALYEAQPGVMTTLVGQAARARWMGRKPRSVAIYEGRYGYRYAVVWEDEPKDRIHWAVSVFPSSATTDANLDETIAGMTRAGLRAREWSVFPAHTFAATPGPLDRSDALNPIHRDAPDDRPPPPWWPGPTRIDKMPFGAWVLWEDSSIGAHTFGASERKGFDKAVADERSEGRHPISIQITGAREDSRFYSVVFGERDIPDARKFVVRNLPNDRPGMLPTDPFQPFDDYMEGLLRASGGRAGQLAIVRDGQLVFSRAYKWGESWYPLPDHTTTFRWASVSKTITAIAIMRMVDAGTLQTKDTLLKAFQQVGKPLPTSPIVAAFNNLTIADTLRHTGGLFQPLSTAPSLKSLATWDGTLPELDDEHFTRLLLSTKPFVSPQGVSRYEAENYYLAGRVVGGPSEGKVTGGRTAYAVAMEDFFGSLGIPRARLPSGDSLRPTDAVPHNLIPEVVASSLTVGAFDEAIFTKDMTLDGARGGWVMAAIDMARFLSLLDRPRAPLLSISAQAEMTDVGPRPGVSSLRERPLNVGFGCYRDRLPGAMDAFYHNGGLAGVSALQARILPARGSSSLKPFFRKRWVITIVINSQFADAPRGRSFGLGELKKLWSLIRSTPTAAWPTVDQFGVVDPTWMGL